ncbi:MAG: TonB-dependent receptor, partial [Bacteroidales bacterium]|nr:TonB-dependent receptor [Bacteroidales bacterium]
RNYGIELTVEKFFSNNYYFLVTTSLFESKYEGSDNIERNSAFNSNYVVNVLGGYEFKLGDNTFLAASPKFTVAGGKRYIPYTVEEGDNELFYMDFDYDRAFEEQYPAYMRLDLRITLRWNAKKTMNEWIMDVQNITNRENVFYESLNRITGEVETEYFQKFAWMMMWRMRF